MQAEIVEQVGIALRWSESGGYLDERARTWLAERTPSHVLTFARGTSENAAAYGRYLLTQHAQMVCLKTEIAQATVLGVLPQLPGSLAVGISQSGQSPDLVAVASGYRALGTPVLGIVNDTASPLALASDYVVDIAVGIESAVAATKSFLAQCLTMLDMVDALSEQRLDREAISRSITGRCASSEVDGIRQVAAAIRESFARHEGLVMTSRGPDYAVLKEGALKIIETCARPVSIYTATDLEHGPVALVGPHTPVLVTVPGGRFRSSVLSMAEKLQGRTDRLITVGKGTVPGCYLHIPFDEDDPRALSMAFAVWLQRLTLALSTSMGFDPDAPHGLEKVTRTL